MTLSSSCTFTQNMEDSGALITSGYEALLYVFLDRSSQKWVRGLKGVGHIENEFIYI